MERAARTRTTGPASTDWAWSVIRHAARIARHEDRPRAPLGFAAGPDGVLQTCLGARRDRLLKWDPTAGWELARECPDPARDLLDLYLPLCGPTPLGTLAIGHLGQSLDGCIATRSGDSCHVTGAGNILHLHRMRALCDAILVGAETVAADDPRLTTRLVPGSNPVRVVLDPSRRLGGEHRVFTDGEAATLLACREDLVPAGGPRHGQADVVGVPARGTRLDLTALLEALRRRGLARVFIEGGGVTVSAFLEAGLLERLQIAVAPLVIGDGRPGLQLPTAGNMGDCLRPGFRIYRMGEDILFDCEPGIERRPVDEGLASVQRVL